VQPLRWEIVIVGDQASGGYFNESLDMCSPCEEQAMNFHSTIIPQRLIAILVTAAVFCGFARTEEMASGVQGAQSGLRIVIVAGDGAVNVIAKNHAPPRQIIIRVLDEAGKPVNEAIAFFQMPPAKDPGGTIVGQSAVSRLTDSAGLAKITFEPNRLPGTFEVEVTVRSQGHSSSAVITQINVQSAVSAGGRDRLWRCLGVGAAAAVVAALLATRSSSTTATPVKQSPRG
jgi:hypothetical protein